MAGFAAPNGIAEQEKLSDPSSPTELDMATVTAQLTRLIKAST